MADQNEMEKIVTSMMEYLCDHRCRFPWEIERKEDLEEICAGCQMGQYVCDIVNTYNAATQLQAAAEVVRNELLKKGDWYNALVLSIHGYFYEMDKAMAPWEVAKGLAERIVGIESKESLEDWQADIMYE
ncbi:hypothetical protein [Lacrimispora sp.]|uniref:hypothetical protein n=1 Tax=Lacrimispora sp. TaxID=2719234 RepID=UPI002897947A|nr:hypothetical protein [Lacrimispora sp.]